MRTLTTAFLLFSLSACSFIDDYDGFVVGDAGTGSDVGGGDVESSDAGPGGDAGPDVGSGDAGPDAGCGGSICDLGDYCLDGACVQDTVRRLRSAGNQSCVVLASGRVRCWGSNFNGQLGRSEGSVEGGEGTDPVPPGNIEIAEDVIDITMARAHSCVLTREGELFCMGSSDDYLGLGDTSDLPVNGVSTPTRVMFDSSAPVSLVSAGNSSTCAVTGAPDPITVWCWGDNASGLIGQMTSTLDANTPLAILEPPGGGFSSLAVGYDSACVLGMNNILRCWGDNEDGRLGFPEPARTHIPTVVGDGGFVSVDVGRWATCAINDAAELYCWGWNYYGQVARPESNNEPITQVVLDGETRALAVSMGDEFVCALGRLDGRTNVYCWGRNQEGQCGLDPELNPVLYSPRLVQGAGDATAIAAGEEHVCALFETAPFVKCWGSNDYETLGAEFAGDWSVIPQPITLF